MNLQTEIVFYYTFLKTRFFFLRFIIFMCVGVLCLYGCVRVPELQELELQTTVSCYVGARN